MKLKHNLIIIGLIILSAAGIILWQHFENKNLRKAIVENNIAQKQLEDKIIRSEGSFTDQDGIRNIISQEGIDIDIIEDDRLDNSISAVNVSKVASKSVLVRDVVSTDIGVKAPEDAAPIEEYRFEQILELTEPFSENNVPIGKVSFKSWLEKPWSYEIYNRTYSNIIIMTEDENRRKVIYNKFNIEVAGKKYEIKLDSSEMKQVYPIASWHWWNPRLSLGAGFGINIDKLQKSIIPNLGISVLSYGKYKVNPEFGIMNIGFGYDIVNKNINLMLAPIVYNVSGIVPILNNTYVGPIVGINNDKKNINLMIGVSSSL